MNARKKKPSAFSGLQRQSRTSKPNETFDANMERVTYEVYNSIAA